MCAIGTHAVNRLGVPHCFFQAALIGGLKDHLKIGICAGYLATACVAEPHTLRLLDW